MSAELWVPFAGPGQLPTSERYGSPPPTLPQHQLLSRHKMLARRAAVEVEAWMVGGWVAN